MNLVAFSIKTKGIPNFARRLWTVLARFGFSEFQTRQALYTTLDTLQRYNTVPTFFIPAVVLQRHPELIAEIAHCGAEIGIHGYVHNDYRSLSTHEQHEQTKQATFLFQRTRIPFRGFRNPYLGWTEDSLRIFDALGFTYDSNEAIFHDVVDLDPFPPLLRQSYEKSQWLFQALPCNAYLLRPHFVGNLLRIPTSIPDDEMLYDRLRITHAEAVGKVWTHIMQRVYDLGGIYVLNMHPERAVACQRALELLLCYASSRPLPVWLTCLQEIASWWKERSEFRLHIMPLAAQEWQVEVECTARATLLARHLTIEDQPTLPQCGADTRVQAHSFTVKAARCPCIGLSPQTPAQVFAFLLEQGYPAMYCPQEQSHKYALHLDLPGGLGAACAEQLEKRSSLVQQIEELEAPLLHFGNWPNGNHAALAISGDIDSVTIQDFFLRILEVHSP